ncbi:MAG: cytochrome c [Acidobacteria bacterium]|nr:cytochrome c [Acidobacteriota bacterium]
MSKYWKIIPIGLIVIFAFIATAIISIKGSILQTEEEIDTIFIKRCAGCHGTDGVPTIPDVPDFTDPKFQNSHTDEELIKSITNGKDPRMPAYGEILEKEQIQALVPYIRKLVKKEEKKAARKTTKKG